MATSQPFAASHFLPTAPFRYLREVQTKDYKIVGPRYFNRTDTLHNYYNDYTRHQNEYLDSCYVRQGYYKDQDYEHNIKRKLLNWKYDQIRREALCARAAADAWSGSFNQVRLPNREPLVPEYKPVKFERHIGRNIHLYRNLR